MAWTADRANRARWSRDQKARANAAMSDEFKQREADRVEGLRRMLAACEADPSVDAMFGDSVRAQLAVLDQADTNTNTP